MDLEFKIRVQKSEGQMLHYGYKDSELLFWKLKILW